jgi:hypothetical protein
MFIDPLGLRAEDVESIRDQFNDSVDWLNENRYRHTNLNLNNFNTYFK